MIIFYFIYFFKKVRTVGKDLDFNAMVAAKDMLEQVHQELSERKQKRIEATEQAGENCLPRIIRLGKILGLSADEQKIFEVIAASMSE